jgi:tRNA(Ile)-lysidine synthase
LKTGTHKTYWVAYSGGMDSHVLLHALANVRKHFPLQIKAIHVHHGLSPAADDWALHCAKICADLKIDFILQKITINTQKRESLEQAARDQRYAVFKEVLSYQDLLLTAHHQNDQAETVLLQLLRGAGPKGLAAMPRLKKMGQGELARPLLGFTREALTGYAMQHNLQWIEDESNTKTRFTRNFLRHEVMPLLETRWPTTAATLARVAANCADTETVLDEVIGEDLIQAKNNAAGLSIATLKKFSFARQRLILRQWFREQRILMPSAKKLNYILSDICMAREDKSPAVIGATIELRRYRGYLYIKESPFITTLDSVTWDLRQPLVMPGVGILHAIQTQGQGLRADLAQVTIGFRKGGERCCLPGRNFHHALKNLFQDWGVPPWERHRTPLIYVENQLAAVVGFSLCEGFVAGPEENGYLIHLQKQTPTNHV